MLYCAGYLCAEDRALRRVARARINIALDTLAAQLDTCTQAVMRQLTPRQAAHACPARLVEALLQQPPVKHTLALLERYTQAFPELHEEAQRARQRLTHQAQQQLSDACEPFHQQRRFAHTRGLRPH